MRHAALYGTLALLIAPLLGAEMLLELPESEQAGAWEPVLQSIGMGVGIAEKPPWARLVTDMQPGCQLEVATSWGAMLTEPVPCPSSASEREEVAALAVLMLEPLVRGQHSLASLPSDPSGRRGDADPIGKRKLAPDRQDAPDPALGDDATGSIRVAALPRFELLDARAPDLLRIATDAVTAAAAPSTTGAAGGIQLGDALGPAAHEAQLPRVTGTTQFNPLCFYTDCAVSFDRRSCGNTDGCSTAGKCPDTYWLDFDRDGFGSPQTCLSLATERGVGAWVQNVGDCDDRHSSVHPQAVEVVGDGIDNNCDGMAR